MRCRLTTSPWVVLTLLALLPGCAIVSAPPTQTVRLQTPGCAVASCTLSNEYGEWLLPRTPGSVTVAVSREPLKVICRGDEAASTKALAGSSRRATSGSGGLAGGLVGGGLTGAALGTTALSVIPPLGIAALLTGAVVGGAAGNAAESRSLPLRYPALISVSLACADGNADSASGSTGRLPLGLGIRGLSPEEAKAAGLDGRTAVLMTAVVPASSAAAAGLLDGDIVLALNGQDVFDAADLEEQLLALAPETPLTLRVWRGGRSLELVLMRRANRQP